MVAPRGGASTHTVHVAGDTVRTTVTARGDVVRRWVRVTWGRLRRRSGEEARVVGMGVQWTPPFGALPAGVEPRPCTLQICAAGGRCLVFQLARAGAAVPALLRRFLADGGVTFAGYNVASDCRKLRAHHGLEVASTLELRRASGMGNASMEEMAAALPGLRGGDADKPENTGRGDWGAAELSKKQVRYACVDAYLSYRLGALLIHGAAGKTVSYVARRSHVPINFDEEDCTDPTSHLDCHPIVVEPIINGFRVSRVVVDGGSSRNIMFLGTLDAMGVPRSKIGPVKNPIYGTIPAPSAVSVGVITLLVTFGCPENFRTKNIAFDVADLETAYHAVLGRPALAKFMAAIHYGYQVLKLPGSGGVVTVHSNRALASTCDKKSLELALAAGRQ